MIARFLITTAVALAALGARPSAQTACLHGASETPAQAARRQAALSFVRQVNTSEVRAKAMAQRYLFVTDIPKLPPLPDGFKAQMATDGETYAFSVKDGSDPCHFAYFSDQDGVIYAATPVR